MHPKHKWIPPVLFSAMILFLCLLSLQTGQAVSKTQNSRDTTWLNNFTSRLFQKWFLPAAAISNSESAQTTGTAICLNGTPLVVLKTEEEAKQTLSKYAESYIKDRDTPPVSINPEGELTYQTGVFSESRILTQESALRQLSGTPPQDALYTVKKQDSLEEISRKFHIPVSSILEINNLQDTSLKPGQKIWIAYPEPLLPILIEQETTYTEYIPHERIYEYTDALFSNEKKVIQSGKKGQKEIHARITIRNFQEINREILSENYIVQPQQEIIQIGTKERTAATGSFIRPVQGGEITSFFGVRARNNHSGVDIAVPEGTTVFASDTGIVTDSGWINGYGNAIILDHQNGFKTLYAHCSKLLVQKGDICLQGTPIAHSGNTGNSTGPHLHFEIRQNDACIDPCQYCPI